MQDIGLINRIENPPAGPLKKIDDNKCNDVFLRDRQKIGMS